MRAAPRVLGAAALAGVLSGVPSTVAAIRSQRDPLTPTRAAGRVLLPDENRTVPLIAAAALVHATLSIGWAGVIAATLPQRAGRWRGLIHGALMGATIAGLDLGLAHAVRHPRLAAITRLEARSQVADHIAFGAVTGFVLGRSGPRMAPAGRPEIPAAVGAMIPARAKRGRAG